MRCAAATGDEDEDETTPLPRAPPSFCPPWLLNPAAPLATSTPESIESSSEDVTPPRWAALVRGEP